VVCPSDAFSILNIGSSLFINPSSVARFEICVPAVSGVHDECHLQAIEEKRGILILDDAFSTNGENSTNCLTRPTRDWLLIVARGRNARRTGNFREGERQHVVRGAGRSLIW
jgi:hypothetical protein